MAKRSILIGAIILTAAMSMISYAQTATTNKPVDNKITSETNSGTETSKIAKFECPVLMDAWVSSLQPDQNFGFAHKNLASATPAETQESKLSLGLSGTGKMAVLLRFDISGLPKGKLPLRAYVRMYCDKSGSDTATVVETKMVVTDWDENKVAWKSMPKTTTAVVSATTIQGATSQKQPGFWTEFDITKLIRVWMLNKRPNYGIALIPAGNTGIVRDFVSRESKGKEKFFPLMVVEYDPETLKDSPAKDALK